MSKKFALLISVFYLFSIFNLSATVIPVTDNNVLAGISPYNWVCRNGCINSSVNGASVAVGFKGTTRVILQVDTDHMKFTAPGRYPVIAWTVNGGKLQVHQFAAGEVSVLLCSGITDPVIDLYIRGISPFEDRFSGHVPPNSVKISGFIVDDGGSAIKVKLPGKIWLTIGDSILAGDGAAPGKDQGRPADDLWAVSDEARASYGYLLARHLGYLEGRLAFGGYNWKGVTAGLPALSSLIDSATSTVSRLVGGKLDPLPEVVLINLGENGAPASKDVIEALGKLRTRVNRSTKIIVMVPVSGRGRTEVTQAFNSYKTSIGDKNIFLMDLDQVAYEMVDGQHPTAAGHEAICKAALPVIENILQGNYVAPETISIWNGEAPVGLGKFSAENVFMTVFRPARPNGTAVVICPGGGYGGLLTSPEGNGIAKWLNQNGITGIVLEYRLPRGNPELPLLDAQRAIRMVRLNARSLKIDPARIGIMGFSAGGHLASTAATHFDAGDPESEDPVSKVGCRPDFAILIYPVISMGPKTHSGSKKNLLGPDPSEQMTDWYSNEEQVTKNTPPAFLAHAQDDDVVSPDNSLMFYDALIGKGVPANYIKLPSGGHGLNGYTGPMWEEWQVRALRWLEEQKMIPALPDGR